MTNAIAHRGPDGTGDFLAPGIAFGHRRLSIIDLAGGHQPMTLLDGSLTVTFNGEIYNFKALRAELETRGARFATDCDTEVLLHGWREWGPALLDRLSGMFAFALWDARDWTLVLARDRLGKKPLHYCALPDGTFAFASEIKALLEIAEIDRTIDKEAVEDFFAYGYVPDPKTIYAAILKLPPAHTLTIKRGGEPVLRRYWDLAQTAASASDCVASPDELRGRLLEAVRARLVADVEVGAFLSGGVDSSAVVALMASCAPGVVNTFSIGFNEAPYDETAFAQAVATRYDTRHTMRIVSPDAAALVPELPRIFDEPFGDVSAIPTYYVCADTAQSVKVCLSGDGGDEALAGYRRYGFHLCEEGVRAALPQSMRRATFGVAAALYPKLDWAPRALRAKTTLHELSLDAADAYFRIVSALPDEIRLPLYSDDFASALAGYDARSLVRQHYAAASHLGPLQRAQYVDLNLYLPGDILVKVDRTSMANSLEVRTPFLDHEFVAWALSLPADRKINRYGGKVLLKQAMEPLLPLDLLYRPKQGFTVPLAEWLRGPLRPLVTGLLQSEPLRSCGMFDLATISSRIAAHLSGRQNHSKTLWLLVVFDAFLRQLPAPKFSR